MSEEVVRDPVPQGATHRFRAQWFEERGTTWWAWSREAGMWLTVHEASYDLLNRQAAPITDFMREFHGRCPST